MTRHGITAEERDAIEAALRASPHGIPRIARQFGRSELTIRRLRRALPPVGHTPS